MPPENCPNCGAALARNAKVCPECGSDDNTGWSDEAYASSLDLPDEEFDYDKFVENEFGEKKKFVPQGMHPLWWLVAIIVLVILFVLWF